MRAEAPLSTLLVLALAFPAGAQVESVRGHVTEREQIDGLGREFVTAVSVESPIATPNERARQRENGKSPVLNGALSFVIPGVGSFYAGHTGH